MNTMYDHNLIFFSSIKIYMDAHTQPYICVHQYLTITKLYTVQIGCLEIVKAHKFGCFFGIFGIFFTAFVVQETHIISHGENISYTLECLIVVHVRLLIFRKISILYALIRPCIFINFVKNSTLYVYSILYVQYPSIFDPKVVRAFFTDLMISNI